MSTMGMEYKRKADWCATRCPGCRRKQTCPVVTQTLSSACDTSVVAAAAQNEAQETAAAAAGVKTYTYLRN